MTHRFYKEATGWYIDLPNWPFAKSHLAMVCGADTLLDSLADGGIEVEIEYHTKPFEGNQDSIVRTEKLGLTKGANYKGGREDLIANENNQLWLCPVTLWVFGRYPKKIYLKVLTN
ncbi:DUF6717 family protein [Gilvibacter sp.]|uniref:DUF6717 family protein n=1 Tax=Gilvibacter sp. TaxID=2729997 RepID=UPI003B5292FB